MRFKDFEQKMREFECQTMKVPPDNWIVLHVDGDNFHIWTVEQNIERPFSFEFRKMMNGISGYLMSNMNGLFSYNQSDEMSILLHNKTDYFNRSVPKLISKSVALASARATFINEAETKFATHLYALPTVATVIDYYRWRLSDAVRNSLNMAVYWTLRDVDNLSPAVATKQMEHKTIAWKNEYLFSKGINFNDLEEWKRRGNMFYWKEEERKGYNIQKQEEVMVSRRVLIEASPPRDERVAFVKFLTDYINNLI